MRHTHFSIFPASDSCSFNHFQHEIGPKTKTLSHLGSRERLTQINLLVCLLMTKFLRSAFFPYLFLFFPWEGGGYLMWYEQLIARVFK